MFSWIPVVVESTHAKLADDNGHDVENLGITRSRDITGVITQNGVQ